MVNLAAYRRCGKELKQSCGTFSNFFPEVIPSLEKYFSRRIGFGALAVLIYSVISLAFRAWYEKTSASNSKIACSPLAMFWQMKLSQLFCHTENIFQCTLGGMIAAHPMYTASRGRGG